MKILLLPFALILALRAGDAAAAEVTAVRFEQLVNPPGDVVRSHGVNRALPVLLSHGEAVAFGGGGSRLSRIARGNERKAVFRDDRDRQEYLDRLIRCRERFGLRVLAFCLMGKEWGQS
jgi:hypothetical protein